MVSSITLGNFFTENGKNVLGGAGGSGLDTQSIVNALVQAQTAANVTPLQDEVTANNKKSTALSQLQTLVTSLQSAANQLRGAPGFNTASQNAFDYVTASVSSNTNVAGSNYMSVSAEPGASLQSYTINQITQLAQGTTQNTGIFNIANADTAVVSSTPSSGQFGAGTITIKTAAALAYNSSGVDITLNSGDSLNTVANDFNQVSSETGITANVVQVGSSQYQLVFTSTQTGAANGFDFTSSSSVSDPSGVLSNITFATSQPAQDAQFTLDGVPIDSASNTVSTAISGLTFTLEQATPAGTTLTATVSPDVTTAKNAIINFMNAYNSLKEFAAQQTQLSSSGTYATASVLATDNAMSSTINTISNTVSNVVSGLSGTLNALSSIGITFTDVQATTDSTGKVTQPYTRNVLTDDDATLTNALTSNFNQVASIFQLSFSSNNSNLSLYSGPTSLPASNLTFIIQPSTSTFEASYYDANNILQTVNLTASASGSGYSLSAPAGSALSGLTLIYTSTADATVNATATQGIADQIYNFTSNVVQQNVGTIAVEQNALAGNNTQLQTQITQQNNLISSYQTQLLNKFSALEQAVNNADTLLASFTAQQAVQMGG